MDEGPRKESQERKQDEGGERRNVLAHAGGDKRVLSAREGTGNASGKRKDKRRPPKTAAVVVTCPEGR